MMRQEMTCVVWRINTILVVQGVSVDGVLSFPCLALPQEGVADSMLLAVVNLVLKRAALLSNEKALAGVEGAQKALLRFGRLRTPKSLMKVALSVEVVELDGVFEIVCRESSSKGEWSRNKSARILVRANDAQGFGAAMRTLLADRHSDV